jgi:hypothetical protein
MTVKLTQVLSTVDDALRSGKYEAKLGKVDEYDVTFCVLDRVSELWKGNVSYKVAEELELRDAKFAIDAESGALRLFLLGQWNWQMQP